MEYRVVMTPEAPAAIDRDIATIRLQASPEIADPWCLELIEAIASISEMPARCGLIPEQWLFDDEFRQLLHGRRHDKRRIIIIIFFVGEGGYVVRDMHGSLPPLDGADEFEHGRILDE